MKFTFGDVVTFIAGFVPAAALVLAEQLDVFSTTNEVNFTALIAGLAASLAVYIRAYASGDSS